MQFDDEDIDIWAEAVFAMIAQDRIDDALQAFSDQFPQLRTPAHERHVQARISAGRQKELTL